jgi:hypothetical protein
MQSCATNETGQLAVFGGMAVEAGGFVDDEQIGVFVENGEHKQF